MVVVVVGRAVVVVAVVVVTGAGGAVVVVVAVVTGGAVVVTGGGVGKLATGLGEERKSVPHSTPPTIAMTASTATACQTGSRGINRQNQPLFSCASFSLIFRTKRALSVAWKTAEGDGRNAVIFRAKSSALRKSSLASTRLGYPDPREDGRHFR